ncbi:MAG: hypothetical protein ISN28_15945 [Ectothiorhodospiraceae bacterium AqS1]|nr:hypothetical protein [Ectothiorhodospiraceae bacterium AqS1]
MKTIISAIIAFAAFTAAHADPSETLDQCTDYCKATKDGMEYEYCEGDCWKDYHKATGQGQGSSLDILDVMPRLTGETQVAVSDCSVECRFEHEDNYGTCLANCQANQQGSVDGTQTASHCVWGPRGYMCFPSNQQGSLEVMPRLTGETQVAVNDCSMECRFEHEDNYGTCLANCQANQQGSVDGTQTAFCVWGPRGYMCSFRLLGPSRRPAADVRDRCLGVLQRDG